MAVFVHPSAIVDEGAELGCGTKVWHFCHVCSGAQIGENVSLGQNVFVSGRASIGNGCKVQNNVSIYDDVILEDDVFCGPSAVFTNVVNPRANIERKSEYRSTRICQGATLGANCTLVCGVRIGSYAFVGAGAVVTVDVKDFALVTGVPARHVGWMSAYGEHIPLPLIGEGLYSCPHTGSVYSLKGDVMELLV
jgi:UDP-2-acetamido-3-amino-2,3-dideoxy-glucuronate N-acetyltransferase